jgi:hypothetical protein
MVSNHVSVTDMGGDEIGFVSQIFFDAFEIKVFLTPEKRFRNEIQAASSVAILTSSPTR